MNIKTLVIVVLLAIVAAFTYMYQSNKSSAEQAEQQRIAYEQAQAQAQAKLEAIQSKAMQDEQQRKLEQAKQLKAEQQKINNQKQIAPETQAQQDKALDAVKVIEDKARRNLYDPESAKFRNVQGNCGEINAKNKFGGYTGYRRFIYDVRFDAVTIEDETDGMYNAKMMDILWGEKCP